MSNAPPPINPYDVPPRTGMTSTGKVLLFGGIGCVVVLLLLPPVRTFWPVCRCAT